MSLSAIRKLFIVFALILAIFLGVNYLFPVLLPFFLGALLAATAEPAVRFGQHRLHFSRPLAAGLGVTVTLVLLLAALSFVGAFLIRELTGLAAVVPDLEDSAQQGVILLQDFLVSAADKAPEGVRPMLTRMVLDTFDGGTSLMTRLTGRIPTALTAVLGKLPDGALGIGTGLLAAFMISARLPRLKEGFSKRLPESWQTRWLPACKQVRSALGGWLKAQLKLSAVTYCIVALGLILLRVTYAPLWAILVAVVDAIPVLGTGTVLLPWALICVLQGEYLQAAGLVGVYAAAFLARSVLEPRMVGKQLGLDPLLTLIALYAGYQFWGIPGMILAPLLATAVKTLAQTIQ